MKITRCATLRANPISCVTTIMVMRFLGELDHHVSTSLIISGRAPGRLVEQHGDRSIDSARAIATALLADRGELAGVLVLVGEQATRSRSFSPCRGGVCERPSNLHLPR